MKEISDTVYRNIQYIIKYNRKEAQVLLSMHLYLNGKNLRKDIIMNITDVRVRKMTKEGKMKAVVSITIDDEFVVHDIKVVEGDKGLFIAMPSRKAADGEYRDIAHPINSGTRNNIQQIVLEAYEKALLEPEAE